LFLLVLAPASSADGAAGSMVCGRGGSGGPRRGGVRRRGRGPLLALLGGEVLELAPETVDQRAGEEQREDPPLDGVGQVRAQRGVGVGERLGALGGRLLGGQLPVGAGD